ncbi:MAG: Hsp20/alpha crystallin family protein [Anaerolineae bacterium]|nr:Hsp20/alpha crystallin family protein [Anaerolineae bacterium]
MADNQNLEPVKEEVELTEGVERTRPRRVFVPRASIYETGGEIVVLVDMPGVTPDNIDITLEKNELKINGYINEMEPEGYSLIYSEYGVGDYERSFVVPNDIDRNKIQAKMKNGVLELRLVRAEEFQARKIEVLKG